MLKSISAEKLSGLCFKAPSALAVAAVALLLSANASLADEDTDIVASANAFVLRSGGGDDDQSEATTLTTKRLNDSNTRIAYLRFDLSSFLSANTADDITGVSLLLNYKSTIAETVRGYGLLETNTAGVADSEWTGVMIWNDQPARTTSPNDIPSSSSALPNANTTPLFFSQGIPAASGVITFNISLVEFKALLADDNNQEVTILFHNTGNNNLNWSSITDGANPKPTLRLTTLSAPPSQADIVWKGTNSNFGVNGDWDFFSSNWTTNGTETTYADGLIVGFDDTAVSSAVNLNSTVSPGGILITNDAVNYTFTGFGNISGTGGLFKYGTGTVLLNNSGNNDFSGTTIVEGGTLQVGNNDAAGNLGGGTVLNNAALVFSRTDDQTVANNILGTGTITKTTNGVLTLGGSSAYDGVTTVMAGTLRIDNNFALGSTNGGTVIAAGSTLDIGAPSSAANAVSLFESVTVGGAGVGGLGAIVNNSSASQLNALRFLTLTDDTVVGGTARWDLRATGGSTGDPAGARLDTGGQPYSLIKTGAFEVNIVSTTVDPELADIEIQQGLLGFEGNTTSAGNPTNTLTVFPGATLRFWALTNLFDKKIVIEDTGIVLNGSGNNTVVGPMTLNGAATFNAGGTSLTLNNAISGAGSLDKIGTATLTLAGAASHSGGTTVSAGTLVLNGTHTSGLTNVNGATIAGSGANTGSTEISGTLQPGAVNGAGTFSSGPLSFTGSGTVVFDLTNSATIGGGVNDLIEVTGDLTANFDTITINVLDLLQTTTPYRLINYSGSLLGSGFNTTINPIGRYNFTLDTATANQVNLSVSGGPQSLRWISTLDATWTELGAANWTSNSVGSAPADQFFNGDAVLFDDTSGVVTNISIDAAVQPSSITVNASANDFSFAGAGAISGATGITKAGTSTVTLGTPNTFTGQVNVQTGTLRVNNNAALGATNGSTVISSGATLDVGAPSLAGNALNLGLESISVSGDGVGGNGAVVNSSAVSQQNALRLVTLTGDTTFGGPGDATAVGNPGRWDIRGAGATLSTGGNPRKLTKIGLNQVSLVGVAVDSELGDIDVQAGVFAFETSSSSLGNAASNLFVQAGATLQFFQTANLVDKQLKLFGSGTNNTVHAADGTVAQNNVVGPMELTGNCWMSVNGGDFMTFSNLISGSGSLTKVGAGTLRLASANSYAGDTTVSNGTLALLDSTTLDNSPVITVGAGATLDMSGAGGVLTVISGQTLQGDGTVSGILTASSGSTLSPGTSVGTLTASSVINLLSGSTTFIELDASAGTNDVLSSDSAVLYGGTLEVTNIAGTLSVGQSFKLFNAPLLTQSFDSTNLPTLGSGLFWEWTPATGTLSVGATVNPNPTNITAVASGGNLTLSWPEDHTGWTLQTQTNALGVGLSTNWFDVTGSAATNQVTVPLDPANPSVFYRLTLPQ